MTRVEITELAAGLETDDSVALPDIDAAVVVCRSEAGLFAVADLCTHDHARLSDGFVFDDSIECPLHQARYDLASGRLLEGPDCPALRTYPIVIDGERVYVEIG